MNLFFNGVEIIVTNGILITIVLVPLFFTLFKIVKNKKRIPNIVCLCGSMKFKNAFKDVEELETLKGNIVLSSYIDKNTLDYVGRARLDILHKRKIDLCDEILVLNVNGYIGDSTTDEINYAKKKRKRIRFLERGYYEN